MSGELASTGGVREVVCGLLEKHMRRMAADRPWLQDVEGSIKWHREKLERLPDEVLELMVLPEVKRQDYLDPDRPTIDAINTYLDNGFSCVENEQTGKKVVSGRVPRIMVANAMAKGYGVQEISRDVFIKI